MTRETSATPHGSDEAARGQVGTAAAEVYEEFFVPALFGQWPDTLLDAASVAVGERVLDVGCGTGVLARAAAGRVGPEGHVTGIDPNPGMLKVAARSGRTIEWRAGRAEAIPFPDQSFDRVVSQFALMFVEDRRTAIGEMARVLEENGTVGIATWAAVGRSPGYAAMVELLQELFGDEAADALRAPFVLGDPATLHDLVAGRFTDVRVREVEGDARFDSIEAWVHTDVRGWTLADMIDDHQYRLLLDEACRSLAGFTDHEGRVRFPTPALIATARKPRAG